MLLRSTNVGEVLRGIEEIKIAQSELAVFVDPAVRAEFEGIAARHTFKFTQSAAKAIPDIRLKLSGTSVGRWLNEKTAENVRLIKGMTDNQYRVMTTKMEKLFSEAAFDRKAVAEAARDA